MMTPLTDREIEVMTLKSEGLPRKHIADILEISPRTTQNLLDSVWRKYEHRDVINRFKEEYGK